MGGNVWVPIRSLLLVLILAGLLTGCGGGSSPSSDFTGGGTPPETAWLQANAKGFSTDDPAAADTDLAPLDALVGNAGVVGLGEATHGTREFFRMKHRLLRYLVEHKGFTGFGMEAGFGLSLAIDNYIQTGAGDPKSMIWNLGYWVWSTEEVLDLVTWMRAYNADPLHTIKLHFFGFDMQDGNPEMDQVLAYLHQVDSTAETQARGLYEPFRPFAWPNSPQLDYGSASASLRATCRANLASVVNLLESHRSGYGTITGSGPLELALQCARVVTQTEAFAQGYADKQTNPNLYLNLRDESMAENAKFWRKQLGANSRVVLWAHNYHVAKGGYSTSRTTMGEYLRGLYGTDYLSLGQATLQGTARAWIQGPSGSGQLGTFVIPSPVPSATEAAIVQAGFSRAFLDLRGLNASQPGPAWIAAAHGHFEIGAVFDPSWSASAVWHSVVLPDRFDLLCFTRDTTPSRVFSLPTIQGQPQRTPTLFTLKTTP